MSRITRSIPLEEGERGYDLEFRQHGRPALRNYRHALCNVVDIHSGVRREPRGDRPLHDRNDMVRGGASAKDLVVVHGRELALSL